MTILACAPSCMSSSAPRHHGGKLPTVYHSTTDGCPASARHHRRELPARPQAVSAGMADGVVGHPGLGAIGLLAGAAIEHPDLFFRHHSVMRQRLGLEVALRHVFGKE